MLSGMGFLFLWVEMQAGGGALVGERRKLEDGYSSTADERGLVMCGS